MSNIKYGSKIVEDRLPLIGAFHNITVIFL